MVIKNSILEVVVGEIVDRGLRKQREEHEGSVYEFSRKTRSPATCTARRAKKIYIQSHLLPALQCPEPTARR